MAFLDSNWARWIGGGFIGFFAGVFLEGFALKRDLLPPASDLKPMSLMETLESYLSKYETLLLDTEDSKGDLKVSELRKECETLNLAVTRYLMAEGSPLGLIPQHIFSPLHMRGTFVRPPDWSEAKHKLWSELNARTLHLKDFLSQLEGAPETRGEIAKH